MKKLLPLMLALALFVAALSGCDRNDGIIRDNNTVVTDTPTDDNKVTDDKTEKETQDEKEEKKDADTNKSETPSTTTVPEESPKVSDTVTP